MEHVHERHSLFRFTGRGEKISKTKQAFFKQWTHCNLGLARGQYVGLIAFLSSMERNLVSDVLGKANRKCLTVHQEQCFRKGQGREVVQFRKILGCFNAC